MRQKPSGEIGRDRAYRWSLVPLLQSDDGDRVKKSEIGEDQGFTKPIALSIIQGVSPP